MSDTSADAKRVYPYLSANVLIQLRQMFQRTMPSRVTVTYLQSALGFEKEKGAKNLLPQLRSLGLIDDAGTPTDLAARFRIDDDYPEVAREIVEAVYPQELRELFPGPDADISRVAAWLMRHTGGGQASAAAQARLYVVLTSGKVPSSEKSTKPSAAGGTGGGSTRPAAPRRSRRTADEAGKQASDTAAGSRLEPGASTGSANTPTLPPTQGGSLPGLHIDIQIHIDAEATTDQIDAVFASMAKHLYGRA